MSVRPAAPAPVVIAPPPPPPSAICESALAATVFFEFDSSDLPTNIDETLSFTKQNMTQCRWNRFAVVGHTDRSGSDSYNNALSMRRAQAVASRMQSLGIDASALAVAAKGESEPKVDTPDGERNPTNRRVEVTAAN